MTLRLQETGENKYNILEKLHNESGYLWVSDSFDYNLCHSYFLYLVLESNRVTVCVIEEQKGELKAIQEVKGKQLLQITENLELALTKIKFLKYDYQQQQLSVFCNRNTLLPASLPRDLEQLAQFEIEKPNEGETWLNQNILSEKLSLSGVSNLKTIEFLQHKIPNLNVYNLASVFLDEKNKLSRFHESIMGYWLISDTISYFCIYHKNELLFFNQFEISNTEDILYYSLNVFDQLKIEPNKMKLEFSGQINSIELNLDLISEYIPDNSLGKEIKGLNTEYLNDSAIYRNHTLLNMFLCE